MMDWLPSNFLKGSGVILLILGQLVHGSMLYPRALWCKMMLRFPGQFLVVLGRQTVPRGIESDLVSLPTLCPHISIIFQTHILSFFPQCFTIEVGWSHEDLDKHHEMKKAKILFLYWTGVKFSLCFNNNRIWIVCTVWRKGICFVLEHQIRSFISQEKKMYFQRISLSDNKLKKKFQLMFICFDWR